MTTLPFAKQWRGVGEAMAEGVKRVNTPNNLPAALLKIEELQEDNANLQTQIANLKELLRESGRKQIEVEAARPTSGAINVNGRPLMTPAEFAKKHFASVATVNRRLNNNKLQGVKQPNGRWLVYADQSITRYSRKKGK